MGNSTTPSVSKLYIYIIKGVMMANDELEKIWKEAIVA
jgi:hypothetical protein